MAAPLTQAQIQFVNRASGVFVGGVRAAWQRAGRPNVVVTSFQRTPDQNLAVGGERGSQHLVAMAADLDGDVAGVELEARKVGLVAVNAGSHLHLQLFPASTFLVERFFPQLVV